MIFTKFTNSYTKSEKVLTHHDCFQLGCSALEKKEKPLTQKEEVKKGLLLQLKKFGDQSA